jgi:hypothetical protein
VRFAQAADAALKRDEAPTDQTEANQAASDKGWEAGGHHVPETPDAPRADEAPDADETVSDETVRAA